MEISKERSPAAESTVLLDAVSMLPALPSLVRYYDEFDDTQRWIKNIAECRRIEIHHAGRVGLISLECHSESLATLLKHALVLMLTEDIGPGTALCYLSAGRVIDSEFASKLVAAGPAGISSVWLVFLASNHSVHAYSCAKALLRVLSKYRLNGWSDSYADVLAALPLPFHDKYAVVRSGEAFLSSAAEASIIRFLDEFSRSCNSIASDEAALQDAGMLLCAYQFGMRPVQIAMLSFRDVRIRFDQSGQEISVHLAFRMVKQRNVFATKTLLRRAKFEWAPIFASLKSVGEGRGAGPGERAFGVRSAQEAGLRIAARVRSLTGGTETAYTLRHTAAQRLVDAGANHEELAEFLGHSDSSTALVYYETCANQAERVNRALGISEIYRRVARMAHERFISTDELAQLKGDQQIAGAPHGVAISGIGGCTSGQPACPFNPIMSCYGCRKFMPVQDAGLHAKVLDDLREIVRFFHDSSRGSSVSPTYLQLERTIAEVQAVLVELEGVVP